MKITKSKLKEIIRNELLHLNEAAYGSNYLHTGNTFGGEPISQSQESVPEDLSYPNLVMELQTFLDEWEQKEYPSDKARYMGYYTDIQTLVEKYDPCTHAGQSCEEAHPGEEHANCIEKKRELQKREPSKSEEAVKRCKEQGLDPTDPADTFAWSQCMDWEPGASYSGDISRGPRNVKPATASLMFENKNKDL